MKAESGKVCSSIDVGTMLSPMLRELCPSDSLASLWVCCYKSYSQDQ